MIKVLSLREANGFSIVHIVNSSFEFFRHEFLNLKLFANSFTGALCVGGKLTEDDCYMTIQVDAGKASKLYYNLAFL